MSQKGVGKVRSPAEAGSVPDRVEAGARAVLRLTVESDYQLLGERAAAAPSGRETVCTGARRGRVSRTGGRRSGGIVTTG